MDPATSVLKIESGGGRSYSGLTRRRENGGISMFSFPDRENTGNLPKSIKMCPYTGKILKFKNERMLHSYGAM